MKEDHLFKKSVKLLFAIDDSKNINQANIKAGFTNEHGYFLIKKFVKLGLVTKKPFELTEKGKKVKGRFEDILNVLSRK